MKTKPFTNLVFFSIGIFAAISLAFIWLWNANPAILSSIAAEEGLIEFLTAVVLGSGFVLGIIFIVKLRQPRLRWIYLPLSFLSLLTFLDEISYGQRITNFEPFSISGIQVDGLHDIIIILRIQIERAPLLFQMASLALIGLILIFVVSMVVKDIWPNLVRYKKDYLRWEAMFLIIVTFVSLIFMLAIPADHKNAWILGYSPSRIILLVAFLFVISLLGWITLKIWRNEPFAKNMIVFVDTFCGKPRKRYLTIALFIFCYLVGSFFLMGKFVFSPQTLFFAYAVRLFPLGLWLTLSSAVILFVFLIWDQESPKSFSAFFQQVLGFFQSYPAYLFVVVAVIFAALAQIIDAEFFNFLHSFLLEEIFEFFASITLLFAALCIKIQPHNSNLAA